MTVSFGRFDNRREPLRQYAVYGLQPRPSLKRRVVARLRRRPIPLFERGAPHLLFEVAGKAFLYAYLRKNGCTSFKNFLIKYYEIDIKNKHNDISILVNNFEAYHSQLPQDFSSILVLRDPIKRICSLFRNKLIEKPTESKIPIQFAELTGNDANSLTFRQFIESYIGRAINNNYNKYLNVHCLPQAVQLWPIEYDQVILLDQLVAAARHWFGPEIARTYFERKVNASASNLVDADASDRPAMELRADFATRGTMPSDAALVPPDLEAVLRELYAIDFALLTMTGLAARPSDAVVPA